ncbi:MAG: DUF4760 domain-containing protein [Edaphobacter sp.]
MALSVWLPVTVSSAGTILAVVAFTWLVHRARFNQSIDLLFKQENDFFGPAKKLQRVKAAHDLLAGNSLEAEPILDFFETMALLQRRKALDKEMVWHTFFYWIDHYYEATKDSIANRQSADPLVWKDLVEFVAALRKFQSQRLGSTPYRPPSPEQVTAFLKEELTEAT